MTIDRPDERQDTILGVAVPAHDDALDLGETHEL